MPSSQDDGPGPSAASAPVASVLAGGDPSSCSCSCSLSSSSSGNSTPLIKIFPRSLFFLPALDRCVPPSPLRGCAARGEEDADEEVARLRWARWSAPAPLLAHGWGRPSPARGLPGSNAGQRCHRARRRAASSSSSSSASSCSPPSSSRWGRRSTPPAEGCPPSFKPNGRFGPQVCS